MFLTPFVLVPLGTLITPAAAESDFTYFYDGNCIYPGGFPAGHDYTPWRAIVAQRTSDKATRVTSLSFTGDEYITGLYLTEYRVLNGSKTYFSSRRYGFNPALQRWQSPNLNLDWMPKAGKRYTDLTFSNKDGRSCKSTLELN